MSKKLLIALVATLSLTLIGCANDSNNTYGSKNAKSPVKSYALGLANKVIQAKDKDLLRQTVFYFDFDKSRIRLSDLAAIDAHSRYLRSHPNVRVRLEGHTDERGSAEYNIGLGERRDQAVARLLKAKEVNPSQIQLVSYGKEKPAVLGHSETAYRKNRRVELRYERS